MMDSVLYESSDETGIDSDGETILFEIRSKYSEVEKKIEVSFRNGKFGFRLAPLCNGFGAAFDGWVDVKTKVDDFNDSANNQSLLEVGDRLASFDGKDLLEATFSEIRNILSESTAVSNGDKFRRRNIIFIKPAKRKVLTITKECQRLDIWLKPINNFFYGGKYCGPVTRKGNAQNGILSGLEKIESNSAVLCVNNRSVAGIPFELVGDVIKEAQRPFEIVFGEYVEGYITSTTKVTNTITEKGNFKRNDALFTTTGKLYSEKYVENLFSIIKDGDKESLIARIQTGINVNIKDTLGRTPLLLALGNQNVWFANVLLAEGSDVHDVDSNGNSVLHMAAACKYSSLLIERLFKFDVDYKKRDQMGCTALHRAVIHGNIECAISLLENIPFTERTEYVNISDERWGWTALHYVASTGDAEIAKVLLRQGADPHCISKCGDIPIAVARSAGNQFVAGLIHEAHMGEPLQCVWPKGGLWIQGNYGPDVMWRCDSIRTKKGEIAKRKHLLQKVQATRTIEVVGNRDVTEKKDSDDLMPLEENEFMGEIWIGSREALNRKWIVKKGISAIISIGNEKTWENEAWLKDNFGKKYLHLQICCNAGKQGWRQFLVNLPEGITFLTTNYCLRKKRVLVVSDDTKEKPLCRAVTLVAALLVTKQRVPLEVVLDKVNERCYFYKYKEALAKSEYLREREKYDKVTKHYNLLINDTNTSTKNPKAKSWKPGTRRCDITDPVYEEGLLQIEKQTQARRLKKMRKKSVKFACEFFTLLNS